MGTLPTVVGLLCLTFSAHQSASDSLFSAGGSFGDFVGASRLVLSPQGWILVLDEEANQLLVFPSRSASPRSFGGFGWGELAFDRPSGISTDGLNFYVSDEGNHRVQRFDRTLSLVASLNKRDTTIDQARFGYPEGVALSRHGDLFILDGENTRIVAYTGGDFKFLRSFGDVEGGRNMLSEPVEIEVAPNDRVLVLEDERIVEFDYFGNYVRSIGEGVLKGTRGFDATENDLYVVSGDLLWCFSREGALRWTVDRNSLGPTAFSPFSDVEVMENTLYVLTSKFVLVLETVTARR
jgi:hypothetical protein